VFPDEECGERGDQKAYCCGFAHIPCLVPEGGDSFRSIKLETAGEVNPCDKVCEKKYLELYGNARDTQFFPSEPETVCNTERNEDNKNIDNAKCCG